MSTKPRTGADFAAKHDPQTVIANLTQELKQAREGAITAEAVREFMGTAHLETEKLNIPQWVLDPRVTAEAPGVPNLMLSDLHWGEVVKPEQVNGVNEFNLDIARDRLQRVIRKSVHLLRILDPQMRYPGIVVKLGGDMIGGDIHEELAATNEESIMPVLMDVYRHLTAAIRTLADVFGNVFVPCVSGNHDRNTKKTWHKDRNATSFGWLLYQLLSDKFADDERVKFYIPDSADALYRVYNTRMLLTHGDQFRAGDSIIGPIGPIMRGDQKKNQRNSAVNQGYDVMEFGHWHQRILTPRLMGNSSLKGYDEYAAFNNFRYEPPSQNLWTTHADIGINWTMAVFCDPPRKNPKADWISVPRVKVK